MNAFKLILLIIGAVALGQTTGWEVADQVAIALLALLVLAWLWSRFSLRGVSLARHLAADRAQVGQSVTETITLRNSGAIHKPWLEVIDHSSLPHHQVSRVVTAPRRGAVAWEAATRCMRRGQFRLGPATIRAGDPLGIFPRRRAASATNEVIVYPAVIPLDAALAPAGMLAGGNTRDRRTPFTTANVAGIRDYAPGDPFNRISWTATARTGHLMVKEFDLDPTADVWLVLDLQGGVHRQATRPLNFVPDAAGSFPLEAWLDSTEEYAVTITASLAGHFLEQGRSVGLIATGSHLEVIAPERSHRQLVKLLEDLAVVRADGNLSLGEVLLAESRRFSRHDTLVVITAATDETWVQALADLSGRWIRTAAIVVEPETFADAPSSLLAISSLVAAGIATQIVKYGDNIAGALALAPTPATGPGTYRG